MSNQYKTYYIITLNILYQSYAQKTKHHYRVRMRSCVHVIFFTNAKFSFLTKEFSQPFTKTIYIKTTQKRIYNSSIWSPFKCELLAENTYTCIKNKFKVTPKKGKT